MQGWKRTARWGALVALLAPAAVTGLTYAPAAQATAPLDPSHVTALPTGTASGPMAVSVDGSVLAVAEGADVALYRTVDDSLIGALSGVDAGQVRSLSLVAATANGGGSVVIAGDQGVEFDAWTMPVVATTPTFTPGTSRFVASPDVVDVAPVSVSKAYVLLDPTTAGINDSIAVVDVAPTTPPTVPAVVPLMLPDVYSAIALSPRSPGSLYALTVPGAGGSSSIVTVNTSTGAPSAPVRLNTSSTTNRALSLAISPDATRLYVGEEKQLVVVPPATWTQATLTLPPASAGYPSTVTAPQAKVNPLGMQQGGFGDRTACESISVATDGTKVLCSGRPTAAGATAPSTNLYWFDATTLKYQGTMPIVGSQGDKHSIAATAARAYVTLNDSSVTSIPVPTVLRDNAVPYGSTPDAPRTVSVDAGNEQFTVSWAAPASNGGLPIVGYEVDACVGPTCLPTAAAQLAALCTAGGTGTTCTLAVDVNGAALVSGSTYRIVVTALNAVGAGTVSAVVDAKLGVPTAPTGITLGTSQLTTVAKVTTLAQQVSWTKPSSSGSNALTSYQVCADLVTPTQAYCNNSTTRTTVLAPATSATLSGLTLAATYVLTVHAISPKGDGVYSTPLTFIAGTPSAPTSLTAKGTNQSLSLTWSPPATTGGSAVTGYVTTISPAGGSGCATLTASATSCTITGLKNGTAYTVTVAATNANGTGPVASTTATPASGPGKPTIATVTPNGNGADVTWIAPTDDGGSPITSYTVTASYGPEVHSCTATPSGGTCTLTGLKTAQPYSVTVRAYNAVDKGSPSNPYLLTLPGAPTPVTGVVTQVKGSSVLVQWNPPSSAGAESIAGYRAVAYDSVTGEERTCVTASVPACSITGLRPGARYLVSVYATNSDGIESNASSTRSVTVIATPGRPTATTRRAGDRTDVTLRWSAVPGATAYRVRRTGGPVLQVERVVSASTRTLTFPKQRPGLYHYTVTAQAGATSSGTSAELIVKVKAPKPPKKAKKKNRR